MSDVTDIEADAGMVTRVGLTPIMHRTVTHQGTVYVGGIAADDFSLDMAGQTRQICDKIERLLESVGSSKGHLLAAQIFVTDLSAKPAMNEVWTSWLGPANLPTRATIGVADLGAGVLIEVVCTAALAAARS
jgi:enamine deaminase RidA (YjgF/YER057c/UK114 family)